MKPENILIEDKANDAKIVAVLDWSTAGFFPGYWDLERMLASVQGLKVSSPEVNFVVTVMVMLTSMDMEWGAFYGMAYVRHLLVRDESIELPKNIFDLREIPLQDALIDAQLRSRSKKVDGPIPKSAPNFDCQSRPASGHLDHLSICLP